MLGGEWARRPGNERPGSALACVLGLPRGLGVRRAVLLGGVEVRVRAGFVGGRTGALAAVLIDSAGLVGGVDWDRVCSVAATRVTGAPGALVGRLVTAATGLVVLAAATVGSPSSKKLRRKLPPTRRF